MQEKQLSLDLGECAQQDAPQITSELGEVTSNLTYLRRCLHEERFGHAYIHALKIKLAADEMARELSKHIHK
jgi:hypothetical protein